MPDLGTIRAGVPWGGAGWTNTSGSIGDGSDSTYSGDNTNASGTYVQRFELDNMPADFGSMVSLARAIRFQSQAPNANLTWDALTVRIVASDLSTILAAADSGGTPQSFNPSDSTSWSSLAGAFGYVNASANKTDWDGAIIEVGIVKSRSKGGATNEMRVSDLWFTGNYSAGSSTTPVTLAITGTFTPSITRTGTLARVLAAAGSFSPTLGRTLTLARALVASAVLGASLTREIAMTLATTVTLGPVILAQKVFLKTLLVASALVPGLDTQYVAGRLLTVGAQMSATLTKQMHKALAVAAPMTIGLQKRVYITLAVAAFFVAEIRRSFSIALSVASEMTTTIVDRYVRLQSMVISGGSWLAGLVTNVVAGGVAQVKKAFMSLLGVGE